MALEDAGERTEQPTPRRRQEARAEGRVARSTDLTAAAALLGGLVLMKLLGAGMLDRMLLLTREIGGEPDVSGVALKAWVLRSGSAAVAMMAPFLALLLIVTGGTGLMQAGWLLTWKKLAPQLGHLSPLRGVRRLFSLESLTRLGLGVLKMVFVGVVAYVTIVGEIGRVLGTGAFAPGGVLSAACEVLFKLCLRLALVLLILGLADYAYQRWQHERSLRMTRQELKDELKRMEGDPLMKARRRQIQVRLAMQRIGIDVPKSDVVVTNPTEYAVALRYEAETMGAPRVMAKGRDFLAERIRQVAQQNRVPIVQRPPLARALYWSAEVGQEVPPEFYRAVAEVLAYVYQLTGRATA